MSLARWWQPHAPPPERRSAPTLKSVRKVAVVFNARSGALVSASDASPTEWLADVFTNRGADPELRAFEPATVAADLRALLAREPDALFVAGGDGTVRSVVAALADRDIPLGVLPCGTMNVLARDLGIPEDLEAAVDALLTAPVRRIDLAYVNENPFLCNSALAVMPHLGRVRERARGRSGWPLLRLVARGVRLLRRYPRMRLRIAVDGYEHVVRTSAVVVSNNPLSAGPAPMPPRERLDSGQLVVYVTRDRSEWDLVGIAGRLVDGTWQTDKRLAIYRGQTVRVSSPQLRLTSVMSDGETEQLTMPLTYDIKPRALTVLAPNPEQ